MRKVFITIIFLTTTLSAQIDLTGGMGINYFNSSSLFDYLNINFTGGERLKSFNSSVEFFIEGDYNLNPGFQVGAEYGFSLFSYNNLLAGTNYDISITYHKPSVLAYYVIPGEGYKFKFGGGIGYRFVSLSERIGVEQDYSAKGIGFLLRTQAFTTLGDNLYVMLGFDARYDYNGEPSNDERYLMNTIDDTKVNLNLISFAFKIGIAYFFI